MCVCVSLCMRGRTSKGSSQEVGEPASKWQWGKKVSEETCFGFIHHSLCRLQSQAQYGLGGKKKKTTQKKQPNRLRHRTEILKAAGFLTAADDPAPKQTNYSMRRVVQPAPFQLQKANTISSYSF